MIGQSAVEVHIYYADQEFADLFTATMAGVRVDRASAARGVDVAEVLALSGNVVSIIAGLLAIKAIIWPPKPTPPRPVVIVIRNLAGDSLELEDASEEDLNRAIMSPLDAQE